ncbi:Disks large-associated protein 1 [Frankliniella fusca]|uniref:Disks large-associated protein 1 n=1 Tax=Frankliniella fusca TaxID=407009 RepID=A0AAE1HT85_9NEOP|nr:Disks large-associated protein 1 [Frankliniella fusca]
MSIADTKGNDVIRSGLESWWQTSFWTSPSRPLTIATMSVTLMAASCDSIGTCSLDVDAESLSDSLIESAQVDSSKNHRNTGKPETNAPSLSEQTLHSFLLSAGTNGRQNLDSSDKSQTNLSSPSPTSAKKPSYLNLACSISGYGGITTYDSKLREGFRSRDHSPGKLVGISNGSREVSPARGLSAGLSHSGNYLTAPNSGRLSWTPSLVGGQLPDKTEMKNISPTFGGGQRLNDSKGADQTDATGNCNANRISDQRNRWLESTLSPSGKKEYQKVVSVFEAKSGKHGMTTETSIETRFEVNSRSQSTVVSSTTVISSNSVPQTFSNSFRTERIVPMAVEGGTFDRHAYMTEKNVFTNGASSHHTPVSTKSFIQQRIERLYGPCSLAQGFFHRSHKNPSSPPPKSFGTNGLGSQVKLEGGPGLGKPQSSPELPVLRHLRPEFRDQLTVAPRRSLGTRVSNGSSTLNSSETKSASNGETEQVTVTQSLLQRSTESIADLQPAAPEVVLPQQSPSSSPMTKIEKTAVDKLDSESVPNISLSLDQPQPSKIKEEVVSPASTAISQELSKDEIEDNAGHKFLKIQRQTIEKLLELAEKAEKEIETNGKDGNPVLSEEALGHLRAAAGKARLLVTQKMVQFEGLCRKCINQRPEEQFPTTAEDLQGFWDMLLLQVDQVHNTFQSLDKLRAVGWCEDKLNAEDQPKLSDPSGQRALGSVTKRTPRTSKSASNSSKSAEAVALRKQREEDRRKLMEQRRRELKLKQQSEQNSAASEETVKIFGAQSS